MELDSDMAQVVIGVRRCGKSTLCYNVLRENAFRDGAIRTTGTDIDKVLPAMSRFGGGNSQEKKKTVIEKLKGFFEKYFGVV